MKPKPLPEPTPLRILKAREKAGLTQVQAAEVVFLNHSIRWSEYERGAFPMPPHRWELFLFKTGQRFLADLGVA